MTRLIIDTNRSGYTPSQVGKTMTVADLIQELEGFRMDYGDDLPVYLGFDNRYTYGSINDFNMDIEED